MILSTLSLGPRHHTHDMQHGEENASHTLEGMVQPEKRSWVNCFNNLPMDVHMIKDVVLEGIVVKAWKNADYLYCCQ